MTKTEREKMREESDKAVIVRDVNGAILIHNGILTMPGKKWLEKRMKIKKPTG